MSHVAGINSPVRRPAALLSLASRSPHLILSTSALNTWMLVIREDKRSSQELCSQRLSQS